MGGRSEEGGGRREEGGEMGGGGMKQESREGVWQLGVGRTNECTKQHPQPAHPFHPSQSPTSLPPLNAAMTRPLNRYFKALTTAIDRTASALAQAQIIAIYLLLQARFHPNSNPNFNVTKKKKQSPNVRTRIPPATEKKHSRSHSHCRCHPHPFILMPTLPSSRYRKQKKGDALLMFMILKKRPPSWYTREKVTMEEEGSNAADMYPFHPIPMQKNICQVPKNRSHEPSTTRTALCAITGKNGCTVL